MLRDVLPQGYLSNEGGIRFYRHKVRDDRDQINSLKEKFGGIDESSLLNSAEILSALRSDPKLVAISCAEMGNAEFTEGQIVMCFADMPGQLAVFLGALHIKKNLSFEEFVETYKDYLVKPPAWFSEKLPNYYFVKKLGLLKRPHKGIHYWNIENDDRLSHLAGRLIVKWITRNPNLKNPDKIVVHAIEPHGFVREFSDFLDFRLRHFELKSIVDNADANSAWRDKLSSVSGIYVIRVEGDEKLYVGSAYCANGIWGRWSTYANDPTGDNTLLKAEKERNPSFSNKCWWSILQILPLSIQQRDAIAVENQWKEKLGSRAIGLGLNKN